MVSQQMWMIFLTDDNGQMEFNVGEKKQNEWGAQQ